MNKTAIKSFAIWARNKLIKEITYKAGLVGVTERGIADALSQSTKDMQWFDIGTSEPSSIQGDAVKQREKLVQRIREKEKDSDYKTAYTSIVEEVAYTWFNRLIAIRFMEVNDYLPSRVRVLSSETVGKEEPDLVTTPFESDLEFTSAEADLIMQYKDTNQLDELFRMLFIKQCNKLNEILPELFEKTADYTELLLNISYTDKDGVVHHLTHDIDAGDFCVKENEEGKVTGQIEIIGWLYQYYNTEPKDEAFALLKKNVKVTKERIPAVTQLFTPEWIVKYMVENSLGRLWIEGHPNEELKKNWKYYLEEAEQEEDVKKQLEVIREEYKQLKPEDIKVIDPCMGSGHILVYAFEVLMQIYESQGYTQRDAAQAIVENNLFGLDIDERAYQLAYFAVMMKGRQYDRRFLIREITPQFYCPKSYIEGQELGSLLNVDTLESKPEMPETLTLFNMDWKQKKNTWDFRRLLSQKYDVVITNPPYMGSSGMNAKLSNYVKENYADSKSDLFAVFIEKALQMTKPNAYTSMITQHAFMFLSSYEKLRKNLLNIDFISMVHLGARAFEEIGGEVVQTSTFIMRKGNIKDYKATYARLMDYNSQHEKEKAFLAKKDLYIAQKENFSKIPGSPIAYWVSEKVLMAFESSTLRDNIAAVKGLDTCDNDRFVREWFEVNIDNIGFNINSTNETHNQTWFPYCKGGGYRKWYGLLEKVVNWENDGLILRNLRDKNGKIKSRPQNIRFYFKEGLTFSTITSYKLSMRYMKNCIFGGGGSGIFGENLPVIFAFLNSKICEYSLEVLNPTLNFLVGDILSLPIILNENKNEAIENIVTKNIAISKNEWDTFETSWDFITHPLITYRSGAGYADTRMDHWQYRITDAFQAWKSNTEVQFNTLKANEEQLNRIFIDIYGLQDELTPEVEDKDVTVRKADLTRDIKSFVSYAVGCMFGRYSLDREGLAYAGGAWEESKYTSFIPHADNIIPITEDEYFTDDIVNRFVEFVKVVYGEETLEENLDFIANALGNKGNTSREIIRNYFIKDFYKDHCKIYQKRPIYWLFDSGKQNGFKALIYMHRYNADIIGNLRIDYLHRLQKVYESEIARMQDLVDNSNNAKESTAAAKRRDKLVKQLQETKEYDQKIAHLALARTEIDLDDGVKVNYEKVQTGADGKKLQVLAKI